MGWGKVLRDTFQKYYMVWTLDITLIDVKLFC